MVRSSGNFFHIFIELQSVKRVSGQTLTSVCPEIRWSRFFAAGSRVELREDSLVWQAATRFWRPIWRFPRCRRVLPDS